MNYMVVPHESWLYQLQKLIDEVLSVAYLGLMTGGIPSPTTTLTDLTAYECDYPGYARQQVTTWASAFMFDGKAQTLSAEYDFVGDGTGSADIVTGWFLATSADNSGTLIAAQLFDGSINIGGPSILDPLPLILNMTFKSVH